MKGRGEIEYACVRLPCSSENLAAEWAAGSTPSIARFKPTCVNDRLKECYEIFNYSRTYHCGGELGVFWRAQPAKIPRFLVIYFFIFLIMLRSDSEGVHCAAGPARGVRKHRSPARCPGSAGHDRWGWTGWSKVNIVRMWEGESSGPSAVCRCQGSPSGTIFSMNVSKSRRALGAAFSLIVNEALVCWMNKKHMPSSIPHSRMQRLI